MSAASVWEATIKAAPGKLDVDSDELLAQIPASGFSELPVTARHAAAEATLSKLHGDPFDRLLVAQATTEPLHLLTADETLTAFSPLVELVEHGARSQTDTERLPRLTSERNTLAQELAHLFPCNGITTASRPASCSRAGWTLATARFSPRSSGWPRTSISSGYARRCIHVAAASTRPGTSRCNRVSAGRGWRDPAGRR